MNPKDRFLRLAVDIPLLEVTPRRTDPQAIFRLISYYQQFPFYSKFGSKPFDYLCGLSIRYAAWTIPRGVPEECLDIHALWLSLVWVMDAVVDKWKYEDTKSLVSIFNGQHLQTEDPFLVIVQQTYHRYLQLSEPYRTRSPHAHDQLTYWTIEYLKNLGKRPVEGPTKKLFRSKSQDFWKWRLVDGAMMCVVWHLILFTGEEIDPDDLPFLEKVSILVSYHNDILSFQRDIAQNMPNLVKLFLEDSHWKAFKKAVEYVNHLYGELVDDFYQIDSDKQLQVSRIALPILEGSYNWANLEARYKNGLQMIQAMQEDNEKRFYQLLWTKDQTAGDPK